MTQPGPGWAPLRQPEQQFLLACLQYTANSTTGQSLPLPPPDLDWERFSRRAIQDGLGALVFRRLRHYDYVPQTFLTRLRSDYYRNLSANDFRLAELRHIGQAMGKADIPLLVLKGGALAQTVYADPALRFMGDLDLMVPAAQAAEALAILDRLGYRQGEMAGVPAERADADASWVAGLHKSLEGGQVMHLEFHWPGRRQVLLRQAVLLDLDYLWEEVVPLDAANNLVRLSDSLTLFYLCLHAAVQHQFSDLGLRHYLDLDRVIQEGGTTDNFWDDFLTAAGRCGIRHAAYYCLWLAGAMFGTPIPQRVLQTLRPPAWKAARLGKQLTIQAVINRVDIGGRQSGLAWRLLLVDHPGWLVKAVLSNFFPGRAYLADYYETRDPWLLQGYRLWHPFHVAGRAIQRRLKSALFNRRHRNA